MNKKIILALLAVVGFIATPALASVQNIKMSGSVDTTVLWRRNFDLTKGASGEDNQKVFLTQAILQVDADLTDKVGATIALINERAWGNSELSATSDGGTGIDLLLAYVTLREFLYSPLTLVIGRQAFHYGNSFIFDTAGTNNSAPSDSGLAGVAGDLTKQTNMDAVRAILDYSPLKIETFLAIVDQNTVTISKDSSEDNIEILGLVGTYNFGDERNSLVEGYLFDKRDRSTNNVNAKDDHIKIIGGRFSTNLLDALNVQAEVAHQGGTDAASPTATNNQTRDAWAYQGIVNYKLPLLEDYNPMLTYVYTKVYGNTNGDTDEKQGAWDPFYENQAGGTIYNTLFSLSNAVIHTLTVAAKPMEDVNTKLSYTKLFMHQHLDAGDTFQILQPDGSGNVTITSHSSGRYLGTEIDWVTTYDYTEDVQFGLNCGIFKPSGVFQEDLSAKQVIANVNVRF